MFARRLGKFTVVLLCLLTIRSAAWAIDIKALWCDTAKGDKAYPPAMSPIVIDSAGSELYGIIYLAEGQGPHPTALLLHGFPGNEKMLDLAQILRRTGFNTVFFAYRGAWGSQGNFSYANCIEDAVTAVKFLRDPENARKYRINPDALVVMGHSMGGFVCMNVAKLMQEVRYFVYFSGWNLGYEAERMLMDNTPAAKEKRLQGLKASAAPLKGTSAEALWNEMAGMKDTHNLLSYVPALAGKKILMVAARRDAACPPQFDHVPLYNALKQAYPDNISELIVDDDHVYSATRMEVARGTLEWLGMMGF